MFYIFTEKELSALLQEQCATLVQLDTSVQTQGKFRKVSFYSTMCNVVITKGLT